MGPLFNSNQEINGKIKGEFGDLDNHLLTFKYNDVKTDLFKWLVPGDLYYTVDSARTFILYFSSKGTHEEKISNSVKRDFLFMPWHEISSFELKAKKNKAILGLVHIGKKVGYEIPFKGVIFRDDKENLQKLENKDWNRI